MQPHLALIAASDPDVSAAIQAELHRQQDDLELIASENYASQAVLAAMGSALTNKYAEGLPGRRYYGGCEFVDVVEARAAELATRHGVGVHVHVAEGEVDTWRRLEGHTADDWWLVHGVHLPDDHGLRGTIVHNPRSNMNNAVGYARPRRFANPVGLGTDGIGADMLDEFRVAFVRGREDDVTLTPDEAWKWLEHAYGLFPEARHDRVTWNYEPMDPWRLAYSPGVSPTTVEIDGEVVLADGVATLVDAAEIRHKAADAAQRLFRTLEKLT